MQSGPYSPTKHSKQEQYLTFSAARFCKFEGNTTSGWLWFSQSEVVLLTIASKYRQIWARLKTNPNKLMFEQQQQQQQEQKQQIF